MFNLLLALLLVASASKGNVLKDNEKLTFHVTSSRSVEEAPTIEVTFANGVKDEMVLSHFKMNEDAVIGCNYLGHLRGSPSSSVGVTGCLNKPGDRMEVTMISENNLNTMFTVDFYGNAQIIKSPFEEGALSRGVPMNRDEFDDEDGDEIFDDNEEANASVAQVGTIPSKLKAVIKFGYEDSMQATLNGEDFNVWIAGVFTHTQTYYRHAASLGTTIEFEVQGSAIYNEGVSWTADDDIGNARRATSAANLDGVATMSWWCGTGYGDYIGMAYIGRLCNRGGGGRNTNLNERQRSSAKSGFLLAHELGHNFGMSHDFAEKHGGENGPCNEQGPMSYDSWSYDKWSTCSRSDWEQHYFSQNWENCLEDISTNEPTEPPRPEVCFDVKTVTKKWGEENYWTIGCKDSSCTECASIFNILSNQEYTTECCLPEDQEEFIINCKDRYSDGWHGGYLEINGNQYCDDFHSGRDQQEQMPNQSSDCFTQDASIGKGRRNGAGTVQDVASALECQTHCQMTDECNAFMWNGPEYRKKPNKCLMLKAAEGDGIKSTFGTRKDIHRVSGPKFC